MHKYIELVEDQDREMVTGRFKNKIKHYKTSGVIIVGGDAVLIILVMIAYITGKSNPMNIGIFLAVVAAFTIPFIMFSFNKVWQLQADIESERVQVVVGVVDRIKKEVKRKRKINIIFMDRAEITVDEEYCGEFAVNDRVMILQGISSKVAISAVQTTE